MIRSIFIVFIFVFSALSSCAAGNPQYEKVYFQNALVAEGWMKDGVKDQYWKYYNVEGVLVKEGHYKEGLEVGYWYFYSEKGKKLKSGHYCEGLACEWWQFFDDKGDLIEESEWLDGHRSGLALYYENSDLYKASKFEKGELVKTWTDYLSFIKDNN